MAACYKAKERKIDARLRTPKNRNRIRWNTVRIFQGREQGRYLAIVRLSRKVSVGQAPTAGCVPAHSSPEEDAHVGAFIWSRMIG